jgi:hypothetical protein
MRLVSFVALIIVVAGCSATDQVTTTSVPSSAVLNEDTIWDPDAVFIGTQEMSNVPADVFDSVDVAGIRNQRDRWAEAFAAGDGETVQFMFTYDAHLQLPEHPDLPDTKAGDSLLSASEVFDKFTAELVFDEESEAYSSVGGFRNEFDKLPWVTFKSNYTLSLTLKSAGDTVEQSGRFISKFRRQADDSLQVVRGPGIGDQAPDFALNRMSGGEELQLTSLWNNKPTVLIFGSYT